MNNRSSPHPTPDDLDRAFSQYFRAQMPAKWPAPPIPVDVASVVPPARGGVWRNRLTLGASVAALLAFGFAVSYGPVTQNLPQGGGYYEKNGTADGKNLHERMKDVPPMEVMP